MAIATIQLDFCGEPVDLHCPVCGEQIFFRGVRQGCCCHLLFSADSATEKWEWHHRQAADSFERLLEEKYAAACHNGFYGDLAAYRESLRADRAAALAAASLQQKSAVLISLSTSDIGCGGMHNGTIHAIFDYLPAPATLITPEQLNSSLGKGTTP